MTHDFRPGIPKAADHLPPPPVSKNSTFWVLVQVFGIFLILRVAMVEMDVRIADLPFIDNAIVWTTESVRYQLWEWGFIGTEQLHR